MVRSNLRKLAILALAALLVAPAASFLPAPATAQGSDSVVDCEPQRLKYPLWITSVEILDEDRSELGRLGFVESGEVLRFVVSFENRVEGTCREAYIQDRTSNLAMHVTYLPGPDESGDPRVVDYKDRGMNCFANSGDSTEDMRPEETCQMTYLIPGPDDEVLEHTDVDGGEQRIRFVIYDEDTCPYSGWQTEHTTTPQGFDECKLAGAERILVVDALPDLRPTELEWVQPAQADRHTRYGGGSTDSRFELTVENRGTYPTWSPNAPHEAGAYFERSAYDSPTDNDESPDDIVECDGPCDEYEGGEPELPPCLWLQDDDDPARCSYRRGHLLESPLHYTINRDGEHRIVEEDAPSIQNPRFSDDKDNAIMHEGNDAGEDNERVFQFSALDLNRKAGRYNLTAEVDRDLEGNSYTPEENEQDNTIEGQFDILGVDLKLKDHGIVVEGQGAGLGCVTPDNPCPAGATIQIQSTFRNLGDPEDEYGDATEVKDRDWSAAVWIKQGTNDWKIARMENDQGELEPAVFNHSQIPDRGETKKVFESVIPRIPTDPLGGLHMVAIRLDHPDNYIGVAPVLNPEGLVAERTENLDTEDCTLPISKADNAFCLPLYFEDTTFPEIQDISTDPAAPEGEVLEIQEGADLTLRATVLDNSLKSVQAHLNHTSNDTNERVLEMSPVDGEDDVFEAETNFTELNELVYRVRASDGQHVNWSDTGIEIDVVGLTKRIQVDEFMVNGATSFQNEENAPRYNGTVSEPHNWFRLVADISGTGFEEDSEQGKNVTVWTTNGTHHATVPMEARVFCQLEQQAGTRTGDACETNDLGLNDDQEQIDEDSRETKFLVDTREERWGDVELPFVGFFNISVEVTDINGRTNSTNETARLLDPDGPPTIENPSFTPVRVNPGQEISAKADAFDGLRVERVFLRVTKPDGSTAEHNLTIDEVFEAETRNGTYTADFGSGTGGTFDQAGTYSMTMLATDFGGLESEPAELPDLRVNDTDEPSIDTFETIPAGEQEVGGNITWKLEVSDSTAVKPPVLRVSRPTSGPTGPLEMDPTGTSGSYNLTLHASPADVGTWEYNVEVEDYTGKLATQEGQIEVRENLPPQAQKWVPNLLGSDGIVYGPAAPTIEAELVDFGSGVNRSSIRVFLNETEVTSDVQLTPIDTICDGCWKLQYTPDQAFEDADSITMRIEAKDHSTPDPLKATKLKHTFTVDANGPEASLEAAPSIVADGERVIGITTDLTLEITDGESGPAGATIKAAELAGTNIVPPELSRTLDASTDTFKLQDLWTTFPGHGRYRVQIIPTDEVGNEGQTVQQTYLFDQARPVINPVRQAGTPPSFVKALITDHSRVEEAVVHFTAKRPGASEPGPEHTIPLELVDGHWEGEIVNPQTGDPYEKNTTITRWIEATDMFGNTDTTEPLDFQAGDTVPTIVINKPTSGDTISGQTLVTWTATDQETEDPRKLTVSFFYKKEGARQFTNITGGQVIENLGQWTLDTTLLPNGEVVLQAFVHDGVSFGVDTVNVTVRNLGDFFQSPEIQGIQEDDDGRKVVTPGEEVTFKVKVNGDPTGVWANVTRDGQLVKSVPLDDAGQGTWERTFEAPSEPGDYEIDLEAATDEGPQSTRSAYAFSVDGSAQDSKSFVPEWTILSILFAAAVGVAAVGLAQRWD